ncbi:MULTISPECIES: phage holin family protein [unclassified Devosia]|uniref:phage holin family protein n=1 Tax=unclassified Devosia TaxID=196773 RepID=UPI000FDC85D9|nr:MULTISPECIES: phage holin family protein [unclassified Devosia]
MSNVNDSRPLSELIGGLAGDISNLFHKEIQLAKAEASEKFSQTMGGVVFLLAGAVLALGALGVFLSFLVSLIAAFFEAQGMDETMATSIGAIIVTVVVGIIAYVLVNRGLNALKASNLKMERTASSLGRDADVVKERL